ncbi:MAG: hypothetical protein KAZ30_04215 [Candidatus Magasanikbacteria bacterium]|nr:hypothetical protein [Candidatus Magasanikbacteria bacterium]
MKKIKPFLITLLVLVLLFISLLIMAEIFMPMVLPSDRVVIINDTNSTKTFTFLYRDGDRGEWIMKREKEGTVSEEVVFSDYFGTPLCLDSLKFEAYFLPEEISQKVVRTEVKKYGRMVKVFTIKATDVAALVPKYPCTETPTKI